MDSETIKAVVTSWPFWVPLFGAVVLIAFLVVFRSPITELIHRIRGISRGGITTAPQAQKTPTAEPVSDPRTAADELLSYMDNQYVLARQEAIKQELEKRGLNEDSPETARVLLKYTAAAVVTSEMEQINSSIWGSQIEILDFLNSTEGASREQIMPYYEAAAARHPLTFAAYPFDKYMRFLTASGLVVQEGEMLRITLKGRTVLTYLPHTGRPLKREM